MVKNDWDRFTMIRNIFLPSKVVQLKIELPLHKAKLRDPHERRNDKNHMKKRILCFQ